MAALSFALQSRQTQLDFLFEQVCIALQLTESQYEDAGQKYKAVGNWLSVPNSSLAPLHPGIYPQGSMRIGTTNRPWAGDEFDLDLICQLHGCGTALPDVVYDAVYARLAANEQYRPILEKKNRCIRLNYAGNFHLDIIPACPDPLHGEPFLSVPDREMAAWKTSNPVGFANIFFECCKLRIPSGIEALAKNVQPLPSPVPSQYKYPLQRIVQMMKRHRDRFFDGDNDAARSIVLTTLALSFYRGEQSLRDGLDKILNGILYAIDTCQGILPVPNPSNPAENFSDSWTSKSYSDFVVYIRNFRQQLDRLARADGIASVNEVLGLLFGQGVAAKAIKTLGEGTEQIRKENNLRITKTGALTTVSSGIGIRPNNFYGR
jgi:hypothetical protein